MPTRIPCLVLDLLFATALASVTFSAETVVRTPTGTEYIKVQVGSETRTCMVYLPPAYDGKRPLPLVIAIHGAGGTDAGMASTTGFNALADKESFIAAYPNGIVGGNRGWNALFGKPIPGGHGAQVDDVDDVGFIRTLIDQLHNSYHTDPSRVFVCGHSSGAYMAYRVAIDLAGKVAAVGVVNGSLGIRLLDGKPSISGIPSPAAPVSVIHIRGGRDKLVKAEGVQTERVLAKSADECVQHFVKADGCATPGKTSTDAERGLVRTLYSGGKAGTEVELVVVQNAGHNWPSPQEGLPTGQELWDFFSKHPKAGPAPKLTPGSKFTLTFPEMPPMLADTLDDTGIKPQMTVFLPTNYDPARKHPLLVFLNGGSGGDGANPGVARGLSEDKDFICVSLPLFKEKDSTEKLLIRGPDCKFGWPFYKTMLARLEQTVPNIDPSHRILGGFSNGAHATAGLIDQSDGEIARGFTAFFFVEGGGRLEHYDLLEDKPFLIAYGSEKSHPRSQQIYEAAVAAGAKATLYGMNNVGHAFPASEYPAVRTWLRGTLGPAE